MAKIHQITISEVEPDQTEVRTQPYPLHVPHPTGAITTIAIGVHTAEVWVQVTGSDAAEQLENAAKLGWRIVQESERLRAELDPAPARPADDALTVPAGSAQ